MYTRNIKQTVFSHDWLKDCTIESYLCEVGVAKNKGILSFDLFDVVTKMKELGNIIHVVGYRKQEERSTVLILKKRNEK